LLFFPSRAPENSKKGGAGGNNPKTFKRAYGFLVEPIQTRLEQLVHNKEN